MPGEHLYCRNRACIFKPYNMSELERNVLRIRGNPKWDGANTRMKVKCLAVLSERPMFVEVPNLPADRTQGRIKGRCTRGRPVQRKIKFIVPVQICCISDLLSCQQSTIQNGDMNEDVFGPTEECIDGGFSQPFCFLSECYRWTLVARMCFVYCANYLVLSSLCLRRFGLRIS